MAKKKRPAAKPAEQYLDRLTDEQIVVVLQEIFVYPLYLRVAAALYVYGETDESLLRRRLTSKGGVQPAVMGIINALRDIASGQLCQEPLTQRTPDMQRLSQLAAVIDLDPKP